MSDATASLYDARLQLRAEYTCPDPPTFRLRDLATSERASLIRLRSIFNEVTFQGNRFSSSVALFQNSKFETSRYLQLAIEARRRGEFSPLYSLWKSWQHIGATSGVFASRDFGQALPYARTYIKTSEYLTDRASSTLLKHAGQVFEAAFPTSVAARDAAAHPEEHIQRPDRHGSEEMISPFLVEGGPITMRDSIVGNSYTCTFKGRVLRCDLTSQAVLSIIDSARASFEVITP